MSDGKKFYKKNIERPFNRYTTGDSEGDPFGGDFRWYAPTRETFRDLQNFGESILPEGEGTTLQDAINAGDARKRTEEFNKLVGADIDEETRNELYGQFMTGTSTKKISDQLAKAREGKGIYAVRRINQEQLKAVRDKPGRQETVLSLGYGTVLGSGGRRG